MQLSDLDPKFLTNVKPDESCEETNDFTIAQGIMFQCPLCAFNKSRSYDGGFEGVHYIRIYFAEKSVPEFLSKSKWKIISGSNYDDLTLYPSIELSSGCKWHGFIKDGALLSAYS